MSGGSMDFLYSRILNAEFELNTPERIAFKQHLDLVAEACKAIEWVDCGDNSEGSEIEAINRVINNLDNVVITKHNLTPLIRRQICNLEADSSRIVADNLYDLLDNKKFDELKVRLEELRSIWGDDSEFNQIEAIIKMIKSWE